MRRYVPVVLLVITIVMASCGGRTPTSSSPTSPPSATPPPPETPTAEASATAPAASATDTPAPPAITPTSAANTLEPVGYPLDPASPTDTVVGAVGSRTFAVGQGATVRETSERLQISADPVEANRDGWDCRVHVEYESTPAVDWYVQPSRPVYATMDGDATLIINTVTNAFDYYGVPREPYIGNPDRARAPLSPFPGPGGGMGVYVSVINDGYRADYGHFSLAPTIANIPASAFGSGYSRSYAYGSAFATPRSVSSGDIVATWHVQRGDVIGYTGDSGYSEAPHLHYAITDRSTGRRLCPTSEPGFTDAGWLSRGS